MNFQPRTEEQCKQFEVFPKGNYDFEVLEAHDRTSKEGNETIELKVAIYNDESKRSIIFDYLLEKMAYKLRHFCRSTNLIGQYNMGTLTAEMCVGKTGIAEVEIDHDKSGKYKDKNKIVDYLNPVDSSTGEKLPTAKDDLPF